jgi:hypothetical protein
MPDAAQANTQMVILSHGAEETDVIRGFSGRSGTARIERHHRECLPINALEATNPTAGHPLLSCHPARCDP